MILRKSQENGVLPVNMTNFGASFKKARESKGVSLEKIASETRISTRFLAAIENEEFRLLPGGIFNRGFIRAFAERIGLDPEQAVADYEQLSAVRDPNEAPAADASAAPARIERHLYAVAAGALVLLIAIFYIVTRESGPASETVSPPSSAVTEPVTPPPAPLETASAAPDPESTPTPPAQALTLEMEAKETTWIKVAADGNTVVAGEILEPGVTRRFTARNSIDLTIGNAAGLALKINDMQVKPLGRRGQVRELNITPSNLKDFTG